jgi:hypothetical protein
MEGARWVSVQGSKLKARDQMTKESLTSIAISEEEGESVEEIEGGVWWRDWSSWTMLLIAITSSTCERVTREGSGFRGAMGTGGKPGVRVCDSMNSGDTCEDPGPAEGVRAERGERLGGGVAEAGGGWAAWSWSRALPASISFLERGGRGGWEEVEGPEVPDLRLEPRDFSDFFVMEKKEPDP